MAAAPSGARVAVIGAGAAGVAAARRLLECGARCTLIDRGAKVGGVWGEDGDGVVWPSLTSNLPTCIMQFPDSPFPHADTTPSFVGQREMGKYLEHYFTTHVAPHAATCALQTAMGCAVTSVRPVPPAAAGGAQSWAVAWAPAHANGGSVGGSGETGSAAGGSGVFDAVVVANGHYSKPHDPVYPGAEKFPGQRMHSCAYSKYKPHEWAGKRVVVVGAKASGTDIARELIAAGASVFVADRACELTDILSDPGLVWHPPIRRLLPSGGVEFEDGVVADDIDTVINCTGYDYDFSFLDPDCGVEAVDRCVRPLYKQLFHVEHPSLVFVGLPWIVIPFPLFDFQARLAANVLTGTAKLPPRDERERSRREEMAALDNPRHAHKLAAKQFDYCRDLARLGGFFTDTMDRRLTHVQAVYKHVGGTRPKVVGGDDWYRKVNYKMVGDAAYVVEEPGKPPARHVVGEAAAGKSASGDAKDEPDPWE